MKIHAPVEQWFSCFYKLWGMFCHAYCLDHATFNSDFNACALLMNENIHQAGLTEHDQDFNLVLHEQCLKEFDACQEMCKQSVTVYLEHK
jgi:hypothetical protein